MKPRDSTAALAVVLLAASTAQAHGPPAGITGVVTESDGTASVLAVSEGFAQLRDGGYRFVCPASFGTDQTPPAASADGKRTFVIGHDDLFVLMPDGTVQAQDRPELSRQWVTRLVVGQSGVLALRLENRVTSLVAVEPAGAVPLWTLDGLVDSVTPDGDGFWVGRVEGETGHAVRLGADGAVTQERTFPVDTGTLVSRVVESGGIVYVTLVSPQVSGEVMALAANADPVVRIASQLPVSGPMVFADGKVLVVSDDLLQDMSFGRPLPIAGNTTCLGRTLDLEYACAGTELFSLGSSGKGARLATLEGLAGPQLDRVPEEQRASCSLEWAVFRDDLGRVGVTTQADGEVSDAGTLPEAGKSDPPPATHASGGCSASHRRSGPVELAGLVLLALGVARSRRPRALRAQRR